MIAFHSIGYINNTSDMLGVLEIGTKAFPIVSPTLDDNWIVFTSLGFEIVKRLFGSILIDCLIHKFEVFHELLLILAGNVLD